MKAGIFQFPGFLAYVAKDRAIKAILASGGADGSRKPILGEKVTTYDKGERGVTEITGKDGERVGAVPNGCTDHAQALRDFALQHCCQCVDCGGSKPEHADDCTYMRDLHSDDGFQRALSATVPPFTISPGDTGYDEAAKLVYGKPDLGPWPHIHAQTLRECGWRPVHRQSARKHRRKGDEVKWVPETGGYWWRKRA